MFKIWTSEHIVRTTLYEIFLTICSQFRKAFGSEMNKSLHYMYITFIVLSCVFHQLLLFLFIHLSPAFSVFWSINDQFIVFWSKVLFYNQFFDKQTNWHTKQRAWKTYISVHCVVHASCNYVRAPRVKTDLRSFEGRTQPVKTVMETALSNNTCRHKQSKESTSLTHNIWRHE